MHYYSAESVIAELKANNALECEGIDDVRCPSLVPCSFTHEKDCPGDPSTCEDCVNQKCTQRIVVRDYSGKKPVKLATLFFYFFFMVAPGGGLIPIGDSHLDVLIRRNAINKTRLKPCDPK